MGYHKGGKCFLLGSLKIKDLVSSTWDNVNTTQTIRSKNDFFKAPIFHWDESIQVTLNKFQAVYYWITVFYLLSRVLDELVTPVRNPL